MTMMALKYIYVNTILEMRPLENFKRVLNTYLFLLFGVLLYYILFVQRL